VDLSKALAFVDTHCHLDFHTFLDDREQVIQRAQEAGLTYILNPGIDLQTSLTAVRLAETHSCVFAAIGVHPNSALTWEETTLDRLKELANHPKVLAIGEIGLDYYRDRAPHELQRKVFWQQLELAAHIWLPVIIHNRDASADILNILVDWISIVKSVRPTLLERPGVLHSFSGEERTALLGLQLNFYLGINGPVTFRNAPDLQRIVSTLPLEKLLIETDAPFLAPHPFRGKRNEPMHVIQIARKIAELQGQSLETVANTTTANSQRLFQWRELVD
jgi:TatD DNase family protein